MFKEKTQLLPRFHLEPIRSLIDKKLFETEDALQKANEIVKELTQKAELVGDRNREKRNKKSEKEKNAKLQMSLDECFKKISEKD